ncbi:MAG: non-heme iron oxygenase ferredoxin subunit [Halieaceae bacterium]
MEEKQYTWVAALCDLPQGDIQCVEFDDREVLICHTAEGVFAVDNLCSHAEARLSDGRLKGLKIFCPLHGGSFDVRDGSALTRPAMTALASYPVRVEGDDILLAASD